jgi:hypothetical protein
MERSFAITTAGFLVPMFSGLLSAFSSATILNIIRKSPEKLSTTYHRLMTSMSIFDFIASICFALVTIPMPKDNIYNFAGPMLGNYQTCQAQGFSVVLGSGGGGALYMCLSWYFVCKITLKMKENTIERVLEPIMYLYAIFVAFFFPSYFLSKDLIGPAIHYTFCTISYYNYGEYTDDILSVQSWKIYQDSIDVIAIWVNTNFGLISIAMLIILGTIFKHSKDVKIAVAKREQIQNDPLEETDSIVDDNRANEEIIADLRYSRAAMIQALMYILAYSLTWLFLLLSYDNLSYNKDIGVAVLFPLQGFWNVIIFVFDKAYLVRQSGASHEVSATWWIAIKTVLRSPSEIPPLVLTNIDAVQVLPRPQEQEQEQESESESEPVEEMDSNVISAFEDIAAMEEERRSASQYDNSMDSSFANRSGFVSDIDVAPSPSL